MTTTAERIAAITTQLAPTLVQAAAHGRLLAQIAEYVGNVWQDQDHTALRIREFLAPAGIHPGQVDADGQPVQPPHDDDCRWCAS